MKLDIHQCAAFWWVCGAGFVFAPVLAASSRPDVGHVLAQGILLVTICIAACPLLLRWSLFRRLFCWTDAMSPEQRSALTRRSLREYYHVSGGNGYGSRVVPYILRILILGVFLPGAVTSLMPYSALSAFGTWYPLGVSVLAMSTLPWPTLIAARRQR